MRSSISITCNIPWKHEWVSTNFQAYTSNKKVLLSFILYQNVRVEISQEKTPQKYIENCFWWNIFINCSWYLCLLMTAKYEYKLEKYAIFFVFIFDWKLNIYLLLNFTLKLKVAPRGILFIRFLYFNKKNAENRDFALCSIKKAKYVIILNSFLILQYP